MDKRRRVRVWIVAVALLAALATACSGPGTSNTVPRNPSIFSEQRFIGHAFGTIAGLDYTNSLEAFEEHYSRGRRLFEVDLSLTADGKVVCFHAGSEDALGLPTPIAELTHAEFKEVELAGSLTPLDLDDLVQLMIRHPDVVVITDTKDNLGEILNRFVNRAIEADDSTVARIVPQVYSFADYETAMGVHPFREVIFSLYKLRISFDEVAEFVASRGNLTVVTLPVSWFRPAIVERLGDDGPHVFVHTVNRPGEVRELLDAGVHGFYTDSYYSRYRSPYGSSMSRQGASVPGPGGSAVHSLEPPELQVVSGHSTLTSL